MIYNADGKNTVTPSFTTSIVESFEADREFWKQYHKEHPEAYDPAKVLPALREEYGRAPEKDA